MSPIRIFISSPGDVIEEREKAKQVIAALQRHYGNQVSLEPVLWEDLTIPATASFQEGIELVLSMRQRIDIAVFILWSRLGSPLGAAIMKKDGTPYLSGTEREFDLMLAAFEQSGGKAPAILAYTRSDDEGFSNRLDARIHGDDDLDELLQQRKLVKKFIRENFNDKDGHNIRAYHSYREPVGFAQRLHVHLRGAIDHLLELDPATATWTEAPYRSLEVFEIRHAPIFCGRDEETCDLLQRLRDQEHAGCAFACIVGASGSGKSSLARAGVAATMLQRSFDDGVKEWRAFVILPSLAAGDLYLALARELAAVLPELAGGPGGIDRFTRLLENRNYEAAEILLGTALQAAGNAIGGSLRLLLVLDQMEELWTDRSITPDQRESFLAAIEALCRSGRLNVIATLRSDFYPQAQLSPAFLSMKGERGHFDLTPPGPAALHELIAQPAQRAGLSFERDVRSGRALDQLILEDAVRDPSALPLLQYALAELYERRDQSKRLLTFAAYSEMGGVEGALGQRASHAFDELSESAQAALDELLPLLISIDIAGEQNAVRRRAPLASLADLSVLPPTPRSVLTKALIAARFLTTAEHSGTPIATFAHEALLRRWDRISAWINANRDLLRVRARVEQYQAMWEESGRDVSRLLPSGLPLEEGRNLVESAPDAIDQAAREFVATSSLHHNQARRRVATRRRIAFVVLSGFAVLASLFGVIAARMKTVADRERGVAEKSASLERGARTQAEANFQIAKASLDKLLAEISEGELPKHPELDQVQLGLLRSVLTQYRKLADQKSTDSTVLLGCARGLTKLASAERHAGTKEAADEAFASAMRYHGKLSPAEAAMPQAKLDRLETTMEFLRQAQPYSESAADSAIVELKNLVEKPGSSPEINNRAKYLEARCLNVRGIRGADSDKTLEDYMNATGILETLAMGSPANPSYNFWAATCNANWGRELQRIRFLAHPSGFVQKLQAGGDPVSAYIWTQFSKETKEALASAKPASEQQGEILWAEILKLTKMDSFYDEARFATMKLSSKTLDTKPSNLKVASVARENFFFSLLQDCYPENLQFRELALQKIKSAVQRYEAIYHTSPEAAEMEGAYSSTVSDLGYAQKNRRNDVSATEAFDTVVRIRTEFSDRHPTILKFKESLATALNEAAFQRVGDNPATAQAFNMQFEPALAFWQKTADVRDSIIKADPHDVTALKLGLAAHLNISRWSTDYLGIQRQQHWQSAITLAGELMKVGDGASGASLELMHFFSDQASSYALAKDQAGAVDNLRKACETYHRCLSIPGLPVACAASFITVLKRARSVRGDEAMQTQLKAYAEEWENKEAPAEVAWQAGILRAHLIRNSGEWDRAHEVLTLIRKQIAAHLRLQPGDAYAAAVLADALEAIADGESAASHVDGETEARLELLRIVSDLGGAVAPDTHEVQELRRKCESSRLMPIAVVCENEKFVFDWLFYMSDGPGAAKNLAQQVALAAREWKVTLRADGQSFIAMLSKKEKNDSDRRGIAKDLKLAVDGASGSELSDVGNQIAQLRTQLDAQPENFKLRESLVNAYVDAGKKLTKLSASGAARAGSEALMAIASAIEIGDSAEHVTALTETAKELIKDLPEAYRKIGFNVLLLYGVSSYNRKIYSYVQLTLPQLTKLKAAANAGAFSPADFGVVVAAGFGDPSPEVRREIRQKFDHSPDRDTASSTPSPPRQVRAPELQKWLSEVQAARKEFDGTPDAENRTDLVNKIGAAALAAIFERKFDEAQQMCKEALELAKEIPANFDPSQRAKCVLIYAYSAHANLFQGSFDKALSIYREHTKDKIGGSSFKDLVLEDFSDFEASGVTHPDLARMRTALESEEKKVARPKR